MKENYDNEINSGIDTPLNYDDELKDTDKIKTISSDKVDYIEKQIGLYDKLDKHIYKHHAFNLLIGCGIAYLIIVILDTVVSNAFSWQSSELTTGFVELVKFVISTLIGYVFSEVQKHKKD